MDDAAAPTATPLDPVTGNPRALMQVLLPAARTAYIRAWELLADAETPLDRRRVARTRATELASDHEAIAGVLRGREASLSGDDLLNARHLADELDRHAAALGKLGAMPVLGILDAKDLRPESLGCGKRYREPARPSNDGAAASRGVSNKPKARPRDAGDRARGGDKPFSDRGPKAPKGMLGTSKHDSQVVDDLDDETRAKLEALRKDLEG
jgi:hypothetical protein